MARNNTLKIYPFRNAPPPSDAQPQDLSPRLLMTAAEHRATNQLHAKIERARALASTEPREALHTQLDDLAKSVLQREIGLEQGMVVHVDNNRRPHIALQVDRITTLVTATETAWYLIGWPLRRDGRVGCGNAEGVAFSNSVVHRRRLDGSWRQLMVGVRA